jgi:hypothetical protein
MGTPSRSASPHAGFLRRPNLCCHCQPGTGFPWPSTSLLRDRLAADFPVSSPAGPAASDGELALAHDTRLHCRHCRWQRGARDPARDRLSLERCHGRARAPFGGATIAACRVALREGVAANIAGGTHHARGPGGGFCVFNDAAVAARLMQAEAERGVARAPLKVAVIDLDVHQGNGTASHFPGRPQRVHAVPAWREELPVSQGGWRSGRGRCPTAVATTTTCTRWRSRWTTWSNGLRRGWLSTWPVPTRLRATAWGASN